MSDEQLTQAEHDAMRRRVLSGAKRIHPVGRHRNAVIAGAVAVVLVLGLAGGAIGLGRMLGTGEPVPAVTPTPTRTATPTATPTPTPTPSAVGPRVAFDGDCTKVLTDQQASDLAGAPVTLYRADPLGRVAPGLSDSIALLGGVNCVWRSAGVGSFLAATVVDARAVPAPLSAQYAAPTCEPGSAQCSMARIVGDHWIGVGVAVPANDRGNEMADQDRQEASARLGAFIDTLAARATGQESIAALRQASWLSVPKCSSLKPVAESSAGIALEDGYPSDSLPGGMLWELLVATGLDQWCSWYHNSQGSSGVAIEAYTQPGVGAPTPGDLSAAGAQKTDLVGADLAWVIPSTLQDKDYVFVAVKGSNRLTVHYLGADEQTAAAAAAGLLRAWG